MKANRNTIILATVVSLVLSGCGITTLTREQALTKSDYELCRVLYFPTWDEAAKAQAANLLRSKGENCKSYFALIAAQEEEQTQKMLMNRGGGGGSGM